jgi:hypothetical protein
VLDGEMIVLDDKNKEHFNIANSIMNPNAKKPTQNPKRQTKKKSNALTMSANMILCFRAFDIIPLDIFTGKSKKSGPSWRERQKYLKDSLPIHVPQIQMLEQFPSTQYEQLKEEAVRKGWEGLILRLDKPYKGSRTRDMLKFKLQEDAEFVIEDATVSQQMGPNSCDLVEALEHIGISYKGNRVWVVSGLTWAEKLEYGKNPKALIGKQIGITHYGETKDSKTQKFSLRHPKIRTIYTDAQGRKN